MHALTSRLISEFAGDNGIVRVSPIVFLNAVVDIEGIAIYQFAQPSPTDLVMRVLYLDHVDKEAVNQRINKAVKEQLKNHGVDKVSFEIRNEEPSRAEGQRGKK